MRLGRLSGALPLVLMTVLIVAVGASRPPQTRANGMRLNDTRPCTSSAIHDARRHATPTMTPIAHNARTLPVTSAAVRIGSAFAMALNPVARSRSMLSTA